MKLPLDVITELSKADIPAFDPQPLWETSCDHFVLFILDGVSQEVLSREDLPNIGRLSENGTVFTNCLTSTPTITGSAHTSIHTGCYPETHHFGFPVRGYIDQVAQPAVNGRLDFSGYVSDSLKMKGMSSVSISDVFLKKAFYTLYAEGFVGHSISSVAKATRDAWSTYQPNYLTVTFYAPDTLSHLYGPTHDYIGMALRDIDEEIGTILDLIAGNSKGDRTIIAIVADHGFATVEKRVNELVLPLIKPELGFAPNLRSLVFSADPSALVEELGTDIVDRILGPDELRMLGYKRDNQNYVLCLNDGYTWEYDQPYAGNHGGFTRKERNVPLIFYGPGVKKETYRHFVEVIDLAPTITALLGGEYLANYQGRPLKEVAGHILEGAELCLTEWRKKREDILHSNSQETSLQDFTKDRYEIESRIRVQSQR